MEEDDDAAVWNAFGVILDIDSGVPREIYANFITFTSDVWQKGSGKCKFDLISVCEVAGICCMWRVHSHNTAL